MPLKDNILFLHVPRTGGTSITEAMGINTISSNEDCLYCPYVGFQHYTGRQIANLGIEWDKGFSVVRDPVMRLQSEWFLGYNNWRSIALREKTTMHQVFWNVCKRNKNTKGHHAHIASYSFMYEGINNLRLLDFHKLQEDWELMLDEWDLPFKRKLDRKYSTKSKGKEKMSYSLKQDLAELYKEDYELLRNKGFAWA